MGEIATQCTANDPFLRYLPADSRPHPVPFQVHERANRTANMVALRSRCPYHRPFHATFLLQCPVIALDSPGKLGILQPLQFAHCPIIRRPVRRLAVRGDHPEHPNQPVSFPMHLRSRLGNRPCFQRPLRLVVDAYPAVRLQSRQPTPATITDQPHAAQKGTRRYWRTNDRRGCIPG